MNRDELFKQTKSMLDPDLAQGQTFLFVGAGSGGARAAEEAVRFGVGRMLLVDRPGERLLEHNIIRHTLGYSALGQLKIEALRDRLRDINPACEIETYALDVTSEPDRLVPLIARATQVYLCTDNERSKHVVNHAAVNAGVPLIFAGVFDGGVGGEVGRVLPGTACYACMASFLQRQLPATENAKGNTTAESFDYANPDRNEHRTTAALNIDIAQIALIQARVGLITLLAQSGNATDELPGNYIVFGNRAVPGLFDRMLASEIWNIKTDPACLICSAGRLIASDHNEADALLSAAQAVDL